MKSISKRLISIITAAVVTSGFIVANPVKAATTTIGTPGQALTGYYGTNPNGQVGKNKTITIDGSFSDWSEDMLISQGVANDDPRIFRGAHEGPVYDTYALYGAWDDNNVYLMWQYTNVTDVVAPDQTYPISDNGKPYCGDIPIMLAFNTGSGDYTDGTASNGKSVWGLNVNFTTKVDKVACFSAKPGVGTPAIFSSVNGKLDYTTANLFKTAGITYKYGDGFLGSKMYGVNANGWSGYTPADLLNSSSKWVDFKTTSHNTKQDTMYEIAIPLKALGMTKSDIETKGLGVMQISTFGASGIGSLPMDMTFLDNATTPYTPDPSSSGEKEDIDNVTVPLAQLGKANGSIINPISKPSITALNTDVTSPQALGSTVQLTTVASGGTGTLQYQYSVNGQVVSTYSSNPIYNWTPSAIGDYTIEVSVKDSNSQMVTKSTTYSIAAPVSNITISSFKGNTTTSLVGAPVTLTASATGGTGTLQYKATATNGTTTSIIKDYSTTSSATWTPTTAGTYTLTLYVKDSNGSIVTKTLTYVVSQNTTVLAINGAETSVASPQGVNTAIKLTTTATGTGTLNYRFAVYDSNSNAVFTQGYGASNTATWTPTVAGNYTVYFKAKDATGVEVAKSINYVVTQPSGFDITKYETSVASPQVANTAIKLTTTATGTGALNYRFAVYDSSSNAVFTQGYGTSNTATWTPTAAGNYTVYFKVKDSTGKEVVKSINYVITQPVGFTVSGITTNVASPQVAGTTISITTNATASSTLLYRYWVCDTNGDWTLLRDYSTSNTVNFKPTVAGQYYIWADVKDSTGKIKNTYITYDVK